MLGVVTEGNLTAKLMAKRLAPSDSVTKAMFAQFRKISLTTSLAELGRIFDRDHFCVVTQSQRTFSGGKDSHVSEKSFPVGVVSRIDLLRYIMKSAPEGHSVSSVPASPKRTDAAAGVAFR